MAADEQTPAEASNVTSQLAEADPHTAPHLEENGTPAGNDPAAAQLLSEESALGVAPQTVFVARHAERIDYVDFSWITTADRPHDAPLTDRCGRPCLV